jgi:hypothetical protein
MSIPDLPFRSQPDRDASERRPTEVDEADVFAYASMSAFQTITDIRDLAGVAGLRDERLSDGRLEDLGFVLEGGDPLEDQANRMLDQLPSAIAKRATFEIALGVAGPDRRLCFECVWIPPQSRPQDPVAITRDRYEVRRVFYRYSSSDSTEVELNGTDREIAEAFGRRVVPELDG